MPCSHKTSCGMFPVISLSSALKVWQTFYCDGDYKTCQRYQRSIAGEPVPSTLLPNGKSLDVIPHTEPAAGCGEPMPTAAPAAARSAAAVPAAPSAQRTAAESSARSSYYLRFQAHNAKTVLQQALAKLRELAIGVDAAIDKPADADGLQTCIVITDHAPEMNIYRAIVRIEDMTEVVGGVRSVRVDSVPVA